MSASTRGWLVDDNGDANVTAAAVSDPAFVGGGAYTESGTRFVVAYVGPVGATDVTINGTLHNADGAMYYVVVLPSPTVWINGIAHNEAGAMYLSTAAAETFVAGIGCRFDGALCVTGI